MSIPPEQQYVGHPLGSFITAFFGQPDIGELTQYDPMIDNCLGVASSPHVVSTAQHDGQAIEDGHTSGRGRMVFSLDIHPADRQYLVQARPPALTKSTSPYHPPPQTRSPQAIDDSSVVPLQPSSSSSLAPPSIDTSIVPVTFAYDWSLDPKLLERASAIMGSAWFRSNEIEPRLHKEEYSGSLFDQFMDTGPEHECLFFNDNGQCPHQASRPCRARSHAYSHFSYAPFACVGHCGKASCSKRFTSNSALNGHCGRKKNPTRQCAVCSSDVTVQNFSRHMRNMHK